MILQTQEICLEAVKQNGYALKCVKNQTQSCQGTCLVPGQIVQKTYYFCSNKSPVPTLDYYRES